MNRKERRRIAAQREEHIEQNAVKIDFTKDGAGDERYYEDRIAQAHELAPAFVHGVIGPDIEDSDGIDRHELPEPIDTEEEIE